MGRKREKEDPWREKEDPWGEKEDPWGEKEDPWANNRFPDFLHRVGSRSAATDLLLIFATISIKSSILTGFLFLS